MLWLPARQWSKIGAGDKSDRPTLIDRAAAGADIEKSRTSRGRATRCFTESQSMNRAMQRKRMIAIQVGRAAVCALFMPAAVICVAPRCAAQAPVPAASGDAAPSAQAEFAEVLAVGKLMYDANTLRAAGKFGEASDVGRQVLARYRKAIPVTTFNTLIMVAWQAELEERAERWPEAESLRKEIIAELTKFVGAENWQTVDSRLALEYLNRLRALQPDERRELYRAAELSLPFVRESPAESLKRAAQGLAIRKRLLGTKSVWYAVSLNNVGLQHFLSGDLVTAESRYVEACELYREIIGENHPNYAQTLHNLAGVYESMGDLARARSLYEEACAIKKSTLGADHQEYAGSLLSLGVLSYTAGDPAGAEAAAIEARDVFRRTLSEYSPQYARAQYVLGSLYTARGEPDRAAPLLEEARKIYKTTLGEKDFQYARCLGSLAHVRFAQRKLAESEALYLEALAVCKETLGVEHPAYGAALDQLAFLYATSSDAQRDEPAKAEKLYREALAISRRSLEETSVLQSERQQLAMGQSLRYLLDNYVALGVNSGRNARTVFANVLAWKGATLVRQRGMRLAADDPNVAASFAKLQRTVGRLSSLSRAVPGAAQQVAWRAQLTELSTEKERLEAELSAKSAAFRQATKPVALEDLLAALPQDAVLVDYLEYRRALPTTKDSAGRIRPVLFERQLVAFVVRRAAAADEQVTMVPLGPAEPITAAVETWRKSFGAAPAAMKAGAELRAAVWEPLLNSIADAKTILVSTDGALGRMPLGALPGRETRKYLIEETRLAMLPVPQLLPTLVSDTGKRTAQHELLLLGDVDYDTATDSAGQPAKKKQPRRPGANNLVDATRSPAEDKLFDPLANTAGEIAAIGSLYAGLYEVKPDDPISLVRGQAGEAKFRELAPRYRHLHLATHGFFAGAEYASALDAVASVNERGRALLVGRESPVVGTSPGLLSGLALAGANREPSGAADDGILTSQEIAALDLSGVDTVVLSACDTGLGATAGGEGLLGVQRAFQAAGVRTTVASYWKVDDLVTRLLMERFYRNLWDKEMTRLDALREAQLYVLDHPEALRGGDAPQETKERTSPRLWGAFSLSGDWR
jgi:CHAT domain-containing protein